MKEGRSPAFDVTTIGAATQDVFLESDQFRTVKDPHAPSGIDACFPMGAKVQLSSLFFDTGGGATNAAATFANLGFKTTCICRIGVDPAADTIRAAFHRHGIDASNIQLDPKRTTGYSAILLSKEGHRSILNYRGASAEINPNDIAWSRLKSEWIYLTSVAGKPPLLRRLFKHAVAHGTHMAWNPGAMELKLGLKTLTPWILDCDIVSLNREEAAELADVPPRHIESAIHRLGPLPKQALIVTDGANGAYVHSRGTTWFAKALKGKRVNTTGAGDAFGSGFVAGAIKTGNIEKALAVGMLNAQGVIAKMGAKHGLLDRFPNALALRRVAIKKI